MVRARDIVREAMRGEARRGWAIAPRILKVVGEVRWVVGKWMAWTGLVGGPARRAAALDLRRARTMVIHPSQRTLGANQRAALEHDIKRQNVEYRISTSNIE